MFSLIDKNIVVCGGSGLLGKTITSKLRECGARVINADLQSSEPLDFVKFDMSTQDSTKSGFRLILEKVAKIDGWINLAYPRNAEWPLTFEDVTQTSWDWHLSRHLGGYFWTNQSVLEHMKEKGAGSVINFASIYGVLGPNFGLYQDLDMTNPPAYAAIKGAVVNMTRYLAAYYGPHGIRVNSISPGGVFDNQNQTFVDRYVSLTPLRRMAQPTDITGACVFLLSEASSYITGHNLMIDGGWSVI